MLKALAQPGPTQRECIVPFLRHWLMACARPKISKAPMFAGVARHQRKMEVVNRTIAHGDHVHFFRAQAQLNGVHHLDAHLHDSARFLVMEHRHIVTVRFVLHDGFTQNRSSS